MVGKAIHEARKIRDLKDLLKQSAELYKDNTVFKLKTDVKGKFREITYSDLKESVDAIRNKIG